jgi:hypothetical protein
MEEDKNLEVQDSIEQVQDSVETLADAGVDSVSDDEEFVYDEEDFDSGFVDRVDSLMGDLNLTRKHFVFFSGCVVILIAGIIFSFVFLFRAFGDDTKDVIAEPVAVEEVKEEKQGGFLSGLFGGKDKEEKSDDKKESDKEDEVDVEPSEEEASEVEGDDSEEENTSISASVGIGDSDSLKEYESEGIRAAIYYGSTEIMDDKLSYYVRSYRKVRNIFNTDLFDFLNSVEDRESGYEAFLAQFKGSNEQAKLAFEELRQDLELFDQRLARINDELAVVEEEFFAALDVLDSERLPDLLDSFQDLANKQSIVKSELLARQSIGERYAKALPIIDSKVEATEVNKDAFVKGVKVVEFDTVDLELIIQGG